MQWVITKTDDSIAEQKMGENIFVGALCVVALAAGIWGWWMERGFFTSKKERKCLICWKTNEALRILEKI